MNLFIIPTNSCFGLACPINDIESYNEIYKLKTRDLSKPLAILINDFEYLNKNSKLNDLQIEFLKNYNKPFTILCETNNNNILSNEIKNKSIYKKIAFRVAHNFIQRKLITNYGSLFLTSANKSGEDELVSTKQILEVFSKTDGTQIFAHRDYKIESSKHFSDIIEFIGDSCEIKYHRQ